MLFFGGLADYTEFAKILWLPCVVYKMANKDENEDLYCICQEPYDDRRFMIACDKCDDWFHGRYVYLNMNLGVES